jgi:hypothetical protein
VSAASPSATSRRACKEASNAQAVQPGIIVLLVLAWPAPSVAQSGTPPCCMQSGIAAGGVHTCAFTDPGYLRCWGANQEGELGNGATGDPTFMPTVVTDSSGQPLGGVQKIAARSSHTCAISGPTAAALCWGTDDFGRLGDGNFPGEPSGNPDHCPPDRAGYPFCASPKAIPVVTTNSAALTGVTALAAGTAHVCAIIGGNPPVTGGNVQCWGWDGEGQLGDGRSGPFLFRPNPNDPASTILDAPAIAIGAGSSHSCAVVSRAWARL